MALKEVGIKVTTQGIQQAQQQMNGLASSIQGTIGRYIAMGAVVAGVASFLKSSVEAAASQEQAERRLQTALGRTSQGLLDYASNLQRTSTLEDDAIINAQAYIASFVKEENAIKQITGASADLAAALGMDLNSAAQLVTKSIASNTNALQRYGIEVKGSAGSSERLTSALQAINSKFGGRAQAELQTYTGQVKQLSLQWGELQETVGKAVLNTGVLQASFKFLTDFIGGYSAPKLAQISSNLKDYNKVVDVHTRIINEAEEAYQKFRVAQKEKESGDRQNAKFLERYNKEEIIRLGLLKESIRVQQNAEIITQFPHMADTTGDRNKLKQAELMKERFDEISISSSESADLIIAKYGQLASTLSQSIGDPLVRYFTDAKYSMVDFFEEMRAQLIRTLILTVVKAIISKVLDAYLGGSGSLFSSIFFGDEADGSSAGGGVTRPTPIAATSSMGGNLPSLGATSRNYDGQVVVNITGNVLSKTFVSDEVIPQIKQAVRLGRA